MLRRKFDPRRAAPEFRRGQPVEAMPVRQGEEPGPEFARHIQPAEALESPNANQLDQIVGFVGQDRKARHRGPHARLHASMQLGGRALIGPVEPGADEIARGLGFGGKEKSGIHALSTNHRPGIAEYDTWGMPGDVRGTAILAIGRARHVTQPSGGGARL